MTQLQNAVILLTAGFVGLGIAQVLKAAGIAYDQVDWISISYSNSAIASNPVKENSLEAIDFFAFL